MLVVYIEMQADVILKPITELSDHFIGILAPKIAVILVKIDFEDNPVRFFDMNGEQLFAVMCSVAADSDCISVKAARTALVVGGGAVAGLAAVNYINSL